MTYNVLYGFHERHEQTFIHQPERARAVTEVVRAEAPDLLALTEGAYSRTPNPRTVTSPISRSNDGTLGPGTSRTRPRVGTPRRG
jgi:hypothetical protein